MNRRRFLSALSLLGFGAATRLRAVESAAEDTSIFDWYYQCDTRLLRGTIPGMTGTMHSTGYPSQASSTGTLELDGGGSVKALIGRFASSQEQQEARYSQRSLARIKVFRDSSSPEDAALWGEAESGYIYAGSIEAQLAPYLVDALVSYPLSMTLRVAGEEVMRVQATNVQLPHFTEPFRDVRAVFQSMDDAAAPSMHSVMNRIEAAGRFEITVFDAAGRELVKAPFDATRLREGRRWLLAETQSHVAAMRSESCPRVAKSSSDNDAGDMGCFLTTAAVGAVGLDDNCWELASLRAFRDRTLRATEAGRALVNEYYREAPRIVAGIERREDAPFVWLKAYWLGIVPCAALASMGCHRLALWRYRSLFRSLRRLAATRSR